MNFDDEETIQVKKNISKQITFQAFKLFGKVPFFDSVAQF